MSTQSPMPRTPTSAWARSPADLPHGPFDLVIASEILYYLDATELQQTLEQLHAALAPGARLVAVHWRPDGR